MTSYDDIEYEIPLKLKQPDRSIPDSLIEEDEEFKDEYEEEQQYIQSIVNKSNNSINFFEPKKNNIKKIKEKNNDSINKKSIKIIPNEIPINKFGSRQFNPRLPFPDKKHIVEKKEVLNMLDDFPAL